MLVARRLKRAPRTVVGYHGCTREVAARILAGEPFLPSTRSYDWLGSGVYFWEYGPFRALEWARERHGTDAAVLEATIQLGECLNLLDVEHAHGLQQAYERAESEIAGQRESMPANLLDGLHYRDRLVIEIHCHSQMAAGRTPYQTVRGGYMEGPPVFPGSRIVSHAHVQIAVRDQSCLRNIRLVT